MNKILCFLSKFAKLPQFSFQPSLKSPLLRPSWLTAHTDLKRYRTQVGACRGQLKIAFERTPGTRANPGCFEGRQLSEEESEPRNVTSLDPYLNRSRKPRSLQGGNEI